MAVQKKSREGKAYQLRDSAVRAAREDGLTKTQFMIREVDGGFSYYRLDDDEPETTSPPVLQDITDEVMGDDPLVATGKKDVLGGEQMMPSPKVKAELQAMAAEVPATPKAVPAPEPVSAPVVPQAAPPAPVASTPTIATDPETDSKRHESAIESPVKLVWEVADQMMKANNGVPCARKDVLAKCDALGIAYHTVRTQYQRWNRARLDSEAAAAQANGKKG